MSGLISADQLFEAFEYRHSLYALTDKSPISVERIEQLAGRALQSVPSAFNSQTTRLHLVLGGEQNRKLWEAITEVAKPALLAAGGEAVWSYMEGHFNGFKASYGTILFFEDDDAVQAAIAGKPSAARQMPQFSEHTSAMHQIALWVALELEGAGASLQHWASLPGVNEAITKHLDLPAGYISKAQLVFGGKAQPHPQAKDKLPLEKTLKITQ